MVAPSKLTPSPSYPLPSRAPISGRGAGPWGPLPSMDPSTRSAVSHPFLAVSPRYLCFPSASSYPELSLAQGRWGARRPAPGRIPIGGCSPQAHQFGYKRQRQSRKKLGNGEHKNPAREKGKKKAGDQDTETTAQ
ncbi:hypothetical protein ACQJBY_036493 [Aegilops geniculata]